MKTVERPKQFTVTSLWLIAPMLLLTPSIAWIWRDNSSWWWDQALYADYTLRLYDALLNGPMVNWLSTMISIDEVRVPGLVWFGQFFVSLHGILGGVEHALLVYTLLLQTAIVWIVYDMCRRLADGRRIVGAACAAFVAAAPLFIGIGHQYFVETPQLLAITWLWRLAVISPEISRLDLTVSMVTAFLLGMAAKVSTPVFAVVPLLLIVLGTSGVLIPRPPIARSYRPVIRILLFSALTVILTFTCAWYIHSLKHTLSYIMTSASGKTAVYYGHIEPFTIKFWRWLEFLRISFLPGLMLYAALALAVIGFFLRIRKVPHFDGYRDPIALGGIVSVVLMLTVYSLVISEDHRYCLPILSAVAIILAWALSRIPSPLVLGFCLLAMASGFALQGKALDIISASLNCSSYVRPINASLPDLPQKTPDSGAVTAPPAATGDLLPRHSKRPAGPESVTRELTALVRFTSTVETDNRPQICAVSYSWLNANLLNFYASKEKVLTGSFKPIYRYNGLGEGEADLDKALQFIETTEPRFIISVREDMQPPVNYVNFVNLPYLTHIRTDPRYEQVNFPSELGIVVFKRLDVLPDGAEDRLWMTFKRSSGLSLLDAMYFARKTISTPGYCQLGIFNIAGDQRRILFQHPVTAPDSSEVSFENPPIPPGAKFTFGIAMQPECWSPKMGDGVEFSIYVSCDNQRTRIFDKYIDPKNNPEDRKWHDFEINLDAFAGKRLILILQTRPGPCGDINSDWAGWSGLEIVSPPDSSENAG